eukprot:3423866-Rhodomonas_salina.1
MKQRASRAAHLVPPSFPRHRANDPDDVAHLERELVALHCVVVPRGHARRVGGRQQMCFGYQTLDSVQGRLQPALVRRGPLDGDLLSALQRELVGMQRLVDARRHADDSLHHARRYGFGSVWRAGEERRGLTRADREQVRLRCEPALSEGVLGYDPARIAGLGDDGDVFSAAERELVCFVCAVVHLSLDDLDVAAGGFDERSHVDLSERRAGG